ncbi:alpha-L-rhamnosidase N-terminal domain-containing protein [Solirubrobacter ginsenosidimutans]|uniref:alpha-L-rhamnosidase n=1 Tax=Solirubrobacter ginsenosidimutans TaxID=490573 RepID=A0A9X3S196_9ACTN|nr:alpha-L-rhamnosidase N-terminal domain-containing protein [Solirubrobacter ginsenosidimutans]MDA0162119.1 alpha-L-rhamnosidase N-terminal domain-containing protein [Solirubrobacter ginsenosidimutans]
MKLRVVGAAVLLCLGLTGTAHAAAPPTQLTVGDQARPLNVEGPPQFGWMPASDQSAYQLTVSRNGATVWDSGKVASSDQSYVPYAGPALANGEAYDWTVKTWDPSGDVSPAATGHFETGLTDQGWSGANWIRRVTTGNDSTDDWTYARKQFPALSASPVTRARIYASAMGQYDIHVNGKLLARGDNYDYPSEAQYYAFDATDAVTAGQPLALGALYHYWTCTCQGRANGPVSNTTLSAAQAVGATNLKVGAVNVFDLGDQISVGGETTTVTAIGTTGATGTGITVTPALQTAHASGAAVLDYAGPSGMIMKAVVDHADGTRETFVTDGTWKVSKAAEFTTATVTTRNGDSGDKAERYDARNEQPGWDKAGFDDSAWQPAYAIGPHPRPLNPVRETFSHLDPAISHLEYQTIHPKSITKLADGSVVADFGKVYSSVPQLTLHSGVAGRALVMQTSYRLNNTTTSAATAAGDTNIKVASVSNFVVGDKITIDQAANGFGKGDPETRTITAVGTAGATGTGITLDAPLSRAHANARFVEGSRAGTSTHDTQGSTLGWWYTEKDGAQVAQPHLYWGWRYLQILPPGAGEDLSADDIAAVVQHQSAPADRQATFDSDNPTLNAVFDLMQHSAIDSSQETFLDTPTREKGQFTGDSVDISYATMASAGDRTATARAIREIVDSGTHAWKAAASGYCTAAQLPCSFPSLGTPGRVNSVYPNGDNMRDIPDYTEFVPEWIWRYYQQSGDKATLAASYNQLKAIAGYLNTNTQTTGNASGLIYNLFGGTSSYQYGIIDWPAQMRYGYTFTNNAARTIHNAEAVGALRAVASAATALGHPDDAAQYTGWAASIATAMNAKLIRPDGLYTDGLSGDAGNPQINNTAEHAQSYPLYYGIAPASNQAKLLDKITSLGMNQGPMTWHVLLKALADGGRYDQVVKLLTDPNADGPKRILDEQGTYMWEQWNPGCATTFPCNPSNNESMSHGWGSWGIVDMVEELLGVQVTGTAASTVKIQPPAVQDADLHRVSGSAWTQRGNVAVSWKKTNGSYVLDVTVPANQKATVMIPNPDGVKYVGVGAGAPQLVGTADGQTTFTVGSGATHFSIGDSQTGPVGGGVGGTVPATLALTLGAPASFGAFIPGITQTYTAATTANVTSSAGDASLTVSDPGHLTNGAFSLPEPLQVDIAPNAWSGPVSNAAVAIGFKQLVKSTDALRTGAYSKTLTFTLSTTNP